VTQSVSKICCISIAALILGLAVVLVSRLVAKEKVVGFSDYQGYGTLL